MERIDTLEEEIAELRNTLLAKEKELIRLKKKWADSQRKHIDPVNDLPFKMNFNHSTKLRGKLPKWAIERYSRQILLPEIGIQGQERICASRVAVVGVGGLGCPAAAYLAAAGIGDIVLVDHDRVAVSNLHRQILHTEEDLDTNKSMSATESLRKINSRINITPYHRTLTTENVMGLVARCNVVLDCSDNVATRYLLGDACALAKTVLVSGSALKMEGQLTVYSYRAENNKNEKDLSYRGPCYRCVFPTPPPLEAVGSCSANGVAGPVPGMIGCLQAMEALKVVMGYPYEKLMVGRMLIFDAEDMSFRTVKLRPRNLECRSCSTTDNFMELMDYDNFCSEQKREEEFELKLLPDEQRISAQDLAIFLNQHQRQMGYEKRKKRKDKNTHPLLVDVRSAEEYKMCSIDGSVNYPINELSGEKLESLLEMVRARNNDVIFMCRRGNDSQIAATTVIDAVGAQHIGKIKELRGGLHEWARHVDHYFPVY